MEQGRLDHVDFPGMAGRRISEPLTAKFFADGALPVPPVIERLWHHWRACARNGNVPRSTAMDLDHLRHLNCLGQFVAHITPNHEGDPQISVANTLPSPEAAGAPPSNEKFDADESQPLHPAEAAELAEDWPIISGGRPILRVVFGPGRHFDRPLARLCLPIRTGSNSDIDSMVMAVEPADHALADLCNQPPSERTAQCKAEPAITGLGRPNEPSSLPLEIRLAFKERIQEATFELKRQAAEKPDAERRGMLLEAARLQRLAQRY